MFKQSILYLGHIVSDQGISTDPENIPAVKDWPTLTNVKELRQFFCFHRFLTSIWEGLCHPWTHYLGSLLKGHDTHREKTPRIGNKPIKQFLWNGPKRRLKHFEQLKRSWQVHQCLDMLTIPNMFHTDASAKGLGTVLYQEQEGRLKAYASLELRPSEKITQHTRWNFWLWSGRFATNFTITFMAVMFR